MINLNIMFFFCLVIFNSEEPWTKEIKTVEETISAYKLLEKNNSYTKNITVTHKQYENIPVTVSLKKNYIDYKPIYSDISEAHDVILFDNKLLAKEKDDKNDKPIGSDASKSHNVILKDNELSTENKIETKNDEKEQG